MKGNAKEMKGNEKNYKEMARLNEASTTCEKIKGNETI